MSDYPKVEEPTTEEIAAFMGANPDHSWYTAREALREKAYGGKPPNGFQSWGDYWKAF